MFVIASRESWHRLIIDGLWCDVISKDDSRLLTILTVSDEVPCCPSLLNYNECNKRLCMGLNCMSGAEDLSLRVVIHGKQAYSVSTSGLPFWNDTAQLHWPTTLVFVATIAPYADGRTANNDIAVHRHRSSSISVSATRTDATLTFNPHVVGRSMIGHVVVRGHVSSPATQPLKPTEFRCRFFGWRTI